jgi:CheY-like chemotaxis protein/HPt (histidine-containing phosphotransfer) domain-containing protein
VTIDPLAFLAEFQAEVTEHLNALEEQLLRLERDPADTEPLRAMFLAAHSIKGGAAMLGLAEMRELSHALEDVLGVMRDHRRALDASTADVVLRTVDRLRILVPEANGSSQHTSAETQSIIGELGACASGLAPLQLTIGPAGPRVLLVEDSPTLRQVETYLLQDAGFVVDTADGANEALARARAVPYVLVIAGVETRELRGPDLVVALRADGSTPHVPVLLTTTDHGPSSPASTFDVVFGPKGHLGNPDFLRAVRQLTLQAAA